MDKGIKNKKWKVFIVTHEKIRENYYSNDNDFNNQNWSFINVSNNRLKNEKWYDNYDIIDMVNLPNYKKLGSWWAEMEAIYNIYINNIHLNYDYIGFIHHDYELKSYPNYESACNLDDIHSKYNITEKINNLINDKYEIIYFSTSKRDYYQNILIDESKPNQQIGDGINCYDYIIKDYNNHFNKNENVDEWKTDKEKNICSAFICSKDVFIEMMEFNSKIIECGKLNNFDTQHKYRFHGGIFERYISVFLDKTNKLKDILQLSHRWYDK